MIETFHVERFNTPTGRIVIVTDDEDRLRGVNWEDHEERLRQWLLGHYRDPAIRLCERRGRSSARHALDAYFEGDLDAIGNVSTFTTGTDFQREVWAELRRIPVGRTTSYGALAAKLGRPSAARAVGLANGANPIAIVVPCHRVVGANASLTGYGGGIDRKRWLLAHERASRSG